MVSGCGPQSGEEPRAGADSLRGAEERDVAAGPADPASPPPPLRVAVTVDDVPRTSRTWPGIDWPQETRRLLAHLTDRDVPFTAFVTCAARPSDGSLLPLWREAGAEPGNHSHHHRDLNDAPLDVWLEDVRTCHDEIARDWGRPATFRYPYLHRGPTEERKSAAAALLDSLGTPHAPVTIDNSEWVLAGAYGDAPPDSARDARFRELYVEHMLRMLRHYRDVARERSGGRDPAHVLLLHANALNARHLGAVLDAYREEGVEFVPLSRALDDPLYDEPDAYTGPRGISWLYRIEPATPEMDRRFDQEEEARLRRVLEAMP